MVFGLISSSLYVKGFVGVFGVYAAQSLLTPTKMTEDHWDMKSTPAMEFWIRGLSVPMFATCYLMMQVPATVAAPVALFCSAAIGVLYPWNAKFGFLTPGLPLKYPMHYVPEALMLGLTVAGILTL